MPESSSRHVAVEVGIQPPTIWIHQSFSHSLGQQTGEKRLAGMRQASAAVLRGSQPTPHYFLFHLSQNLCSRALLDLVLLEQNMTKHLSDATPHVDHPGLLYVVFFLIFFRNHFRPTNTAKKKKKKKKRNWKVTCCLHTMKGLATYSRGGSGNRCACSWTKREKVKRHLLFEVMQKDKECINSLTAS